MGRLTDEFVVLWGNATTIVDDLKRLESVVLEAHLSTPCEVPFGNTGARDIPMLVAPASKLFSNSSFNADAGR